MLWSTDYRLSQPVSERDRREYSKALEEWRKWVFQQGVTGVYKNTRQKIDKGENMSTEIMLPVTQPSLLYPSIYGLRPKEKHFRCPKCGSNNRTSISSVYLKKDGEEKIYGFNCSWCKRGWFVSSKLILNSILEDQIKQMSEFTKKTGKEFGALIIRTSRGIMLEMIQIGEDRSINMGATRKLQSDEEILGTIHCHPISDFPSDWDISDFLCSSWERISIVIGNEENLNVLIKTIDTSQLEDREKVVEQLKDKSLDDIGKEYNFIVYRGKLDNLKSSILATEVTLEDLLKNVKGVKTI